MKNLFNNIICRIFGHRASLYAIQARPKKCIYKIDRYRCKCGKKELFSVNNGGPLWKLSEDIKNQYKWRVISWIQ